VNTDLRNAIDPPIPCEWEPCTANGTAITNVTNFAPIPASWSEPGHDIVGAILNAGKLIVKQRAAEIAARVWCDPAMRHVVMDRDAANRIAAIVAEVLRAQL
jgi:hypothetical protein